MNLIKRLLLAIAMTTTLIACSSQKQEEIAAEANLPAVPSIPTYDAETFFETTTIFGSEISPQGNAVLVSSDKSGVFNAYKYPLDGGEPIPLTNSTTDAVWVETWLEGNDRILFSSDQGGNELDHLYVRESDGQIIDITPGENLKAAFLGWHEDKDYFYVMTNERDNSSFDVYLYSAKDYGRLMLFENKDALEISDISPDGKYLAAIKVVNNRKTDIYIVDLQTRDKTPKLITNPRAQVAHQTFTFTPDSQRLIYGSNGRGEFVEAYAYSIKTGRSEPFYSADWDVSFLYFSDSGKYQIIGVNQDAQTKLSIIDSRTKRELKLPTLPQGDLRGVNFSEDDRTLVFYVNSDSSPSNLYVHRIGTFEVTALTDTLNPEIDGELLVESTVERFESFDGLEIPGLLYKPNQASATTKVPAIILVHGGPGGQARKGYDPLIQHLVNNGYAIFDVNNRGSSGYGKTFYHLDDKRHGEDDLQDIVYGKYYLQTLDWIDADRIAVMGGSYGGYMTMAAMAFTDEFKLGINIFGVTNWVRTLESIPPWWESFRQALYDELGDPTTDKERLTRISPLFHADKIKNPVLVVQGANDPRVLQIESDEMVANMRANNVPVEYVLFEDEGHGFTKKANRITAQKAYLSFLQQYL